MHGPPMLLRGRQTFVVFPGWTPKHQDNNPAETALRRGHQLWIAIYYLLSRPSKDEDIRRTEDS